MSVCLSLSLLLCLPTFQGFQGADPGPISVQNPTKLAVLYAGAPDSSRAADFLKFLRGEFERVESVDLRQLDEAKAKGFDVIVADWDRYYGAPEEVGKNRPKFAMTKAWSRPTVMVGAVGGEMGKALESKLDWG